MKAADDSQKPEKVPLFTDNITVFITPTQAIEERPVITAKAVSNYGLINARHSDSDVIKCKAATVESSLKMQLQLQEKDGKGVREQLHGSREMREIQITATHRGREQGRGQDVVTGEETLLYLARSTVSHV